MDIKTMSFEELETRKAAIAVESEAEGADVDALLEEIRSINAEIEERKAHEAKQAELRSAVAAGAGTVIESAEAEERKDTKMDLAEIRKSEAYMSRVRKAYLRGNLKVGFEISSDGAVVFTEGNATEIDPENLVLGIVEIVPASIK